MSSILLLGDAHLRDRDPEIDVFIRFLASLPADATALYLLGDLFDLWIGSPAFTGPGHLRVAEALRRLRLGGLRIAYVEGNRDYHLRSCYLEDPFHDLAEEGMEVRFGGRRIYLAHGDLVNRRDRQYRLWRRVAKGPWLIRAFRSIPSGPAQRLAVWMEDQRGRTNLRNRVQFPEEECRTYAEGKREEGYDTLVLGHFHREMRLLVDGARGRVEIFVLPSWREGRRFLRIGSDGIAEFESYDPPSAGGPA